jgi:hypothetical protein
MKTWSWKPEKNQKLKEMGRPGFEAVLLALEQGGFRDVLSNLGYPNQKLLVVMIDGYAHVVPFKETDETFFLFTVYPSRIYQKIYGVNKK